MSLDTILSEFHQYWSSLAKTMKCFLSPEKLRNLKYDNLTVQRRYYQRTSLLKSLGASFHQISCCSCCWNRIENLFKWSCSIYDTWLKLKKKKKQKKTLFFKSKNCSNDNPFIGCNDRIGKMFHNICISAVAVSLRWVSRGLWTSCFS